LWRYKYCYICGDIHFDNECFTTRKTKPGDGKYNLSSVATYELDHALGLSNSNQADYVMATIISFQEIADKTIPV